MKFRILLIATNFGLYRVVCDTTNIHEAIEAFRLTISTKRIGGESISTYCWEDEITLSSLDTGDDISPPMLFP